MKLVICLFVICIFCLPAYAGHSIFVKDSLQEGEAKAYQTDNGIYVVELVVVSGQSAKFRINNRLLTTLEEKDADALPDRSELVVKNILVNDQYDEAEYYFYGSGESPLDVDLDQTWTIEDCNFDDICGENETKDLCCYDCGCSSGYRCLRNRCMKLTGCISDEECADDNPCTIDLCEETSCKYETIQGCQQGDECVSYGTTTETEYCSDQGWTDRKQAGKQCFNGYECQDSICRNNRCYKSPWSRIIWISIPLVIILSVIFYAGREGSFKQLLNRTKKKLFWKF